MQSTDERSKIFLQEANKSRIIWGFEGGNGFPDAGTFPAITEIDSKVSMFYWSTKEKAVAFMEKDKEYNNLVLTEYPYKHFCLLLDENDKFNIMVGLNAEDRESTPLFEPADILKMCVV